MAPDPALRGEIRAALPPQPSLCLLSIDMLRRYKCRILRGQKPSPRPAKGGAQQGAG